MGWAPVLPTAPNYCDAGLGRHYRGAGKRSGQSVVKSVQKNAHLPERIIRTPSEPGNIRTPEPGNTALDYYAGSGTTLLAAARPGRRFIGTDDSPAV